MLRITHCCCCFSLRSGMLILGWAQVILSLLALCGVIIETSSDSTSSIHRLLGATVIALYVLLGGSVLQTIAAACLLYGVYMKRSGLIFEYVKLETLLHIASLLEFIIFLILEHSSFSQQEIYIFLGFLGLNYGLAVYYLLAAYSYYKTLTEEGVYTPLLQP